MSFVSPFIQTHITIPKNDLIDSPHKELSYPIDAIIPKWRGNEKCDTTTRFTKGSINTNNATAAAVFANGKAFICCVERKVFVTTINHAFELCVSTKYELKSRRVAVVLYFLVDRRQKKISHTHRTGRTTNNVWYFMIMSYFRFPPAFYAMQMPELFILIFSDDICSSEEMR